MTDVESLPAEVAEQARWQARWCARLGSPLYADIIERVAADIEAGGPFRPLMTDPAMHPLEGLPLLRLLGSANRLALTGRAPAVSWEVLRDLAENRPDELRERINSPVQTNEVARCGPLSAGFLFIARETGLPLRLMEVGASAGLNLRFDRYRYETPGGGFGPATSPVRLTEFWGGGEPPYDAADVRVIERRGCDLEPVDPTSEEGRLTLLSYVWPDQHERVAHLRGALEAAREVPAPVERADARTWVESELAELPGGTATVLFHSIVMQYL